MGKTICMIHGMWGTGGYWDAYRRFFEARGYACRTPTLRFHERDPAEPPDPRLGTTSLLDYASDLEAEVRSLDEPPVLMGHSMGGLLAQILGGRGLARALVLLAPAPPRGITVLKYSVLKSFREVFTTWGFWKKPQKISFEAYQYAVLHRMPLERQKEIYGDLVDDSGRALWEIGFWLLDRQRTTAVDAAGVTCPVLVVAGKDDRIVTAPVIRKVAARYDATYREYAHHAHWIVGEPGWEEIAGEINGWLNEHVGG